MNLSKSDPVETGHHRQQRDQRLTKVRLASPDCPEDVSATGPRERPAPMGGRIGPVPRPRQPLCETFATGPLPSRSHQRVTPYRPDAAALLSCDPLRLHDVACNACITPAHGQKPPLNAPRRHYRRGTILFLQCNSVAFAKMNIDLTPLRTHGAPILPSEPFECWTKTKKPT